MVMLVQNYTKEGLTTMKNTFKILSIATLLLSILCGVSKNASAQNAALPIRGKIQYVHGTSIPWLDTFYSTDIGFNPLHPDWGNHYNATKVDLYLKEIKALNMNVVRVWLFEGLEGLEFDANGYVSGIQPTFLANLDDMMTRTNTYGLALYFALLNGNELHTLWGQILPNGAPIQNFVSDPTARQRFLDNVITPLANRYMGNLGLFAHEVLNEANEGADLGAYSWGDMRSFIQDVATRFHAVAPGTLVSASMDWRDAFSTEFLPVSLGGLGLDFYDSHLYSDAPNLYTVGTPALNPDKPILLGEYGRFTQLTDDNLQNTNGVAFIQQARERKWNGTVQWSYLVDGSNREIRRANGTFRPLASTLRSFGKGLQDTALFNFEWSSQGWLRSNTRIASILRSTAKAFSGNCSLAVAFNATQSGYVNAYVPATTLNAQNQFTFRIWIPAGSSIATVAPYLTKGATFVSNRKYVSNLQAGAWNTITLDVPAGVAFPISTIGVQFYVNAPYTGTVYIDSIN